MQIGTFFFIRVPLGRETRLCPRLGLRGQAELFTYLLYLFGLLNHRLINIDLALLKWRHGAKRIIHIADAPGYGHGYGGSFNGEK
jgi:hypothetical protein